MKAILERQNRILLREANALIDELAKISIPIELTQYHQKILELCEEVRETINENLEMLEHIDQAGILKNVISNTRLAIHRLRDLSAIAAPPILRTRERDKLGLTIVNWLHGAHPKTVQHGAGLSNDRWSVWPIYGRPIYYLPFSEQDRLLQLPLFFHEFGHVLYICHEQEMEDLIKEMQIKLLRILTPSRRRNDTYDKKQMVQRQRIAYVWFNWIQELFCDAVGLTIGGPAFLRAFSAYMNTLSQGDFRRGISDLAKSTHPISWLRIQFLTRMARNEGYLDLADKVDQEWKRTAQMMHIEEDYFGFYHASLESTVKETIGYMLVESEPVKFEPDILSATSDNNSFSPIRLLNVAWQQYEQDPENYSIWEMAEVAKILAPSQSA